METEVEAAEVLYDIAQAARLLGVSAQLVRKMIENGTLGAIRLGSRFRVSSSHIAALTETAAYVPGTGIKRKRKPKAADKAADNGKTAAAAPAKGKAGATA